MSTPLNQPDEPVASDQPDPGTSDEGLERDGEQIPYAPNRDRAEEPDADDLVNQTGAADDAGA